MHNINENSHWYKISQTSAYTGSYEKITLAIKTKDTKINRANKLSKLKKKAKASKLKEKALRRWTKADQEKTLRRLDKNETKEYKRLIKRYKI